MALSKEKEQEYIEKVKKDPMFLTEIETQTEAICLEAVKQKGWALEYVKEKTPEICLEAVKQNGMALEYVNEQTHRICLEAIKENGWSLEYIEEQTEELTLASFPNLSRMYQEWDLWNYSSFFKLLKNPTQEITSLYNLLEYWEERWPSYREIRSKLATGELTVHQSPYHVLDCLYR